MDCDCGIRLRRTLHTGPTVARRPRFAHAPLAGGEGEFEIRSVESTHKEATSHYSCTARNTATQRSRHSLD
jgi:hypothetical protein